MKRILILLAMFGFVGCADSKLELPKPPKEIIAKYGDTDKVRLHWQLYKMEKTLVEHSKALQATTQPTTQPK